MKGFLIRGWNPILPGGGRTLTLARGATLAARSLHEPLPISNQPVRLGFPHRAGDIDPRDLRVRLRVVAAVGMEGFLIRGWKLILPRCGATSALARAATLATRWLHEPQPISNQLVWG